MPVTRFFVNRVWRTNNQIDLSAAPNLRTLAAAGFTNLDVYVFHNFKSSFSHTKAIDQVIAYLKKENVFSLVKRIWLDIERDVDGVYMWSTKDLNANFKKVKEQVERVQSYGKLPGIYGPGADGWKEICGKNSLPVKTPFWYVSHNYNNDGSNAAFEPVANWQSTADVIHQFATTGVSVCGGPNVDWNFRSGESQIPYNWDPVHNVGI